MNWTDLDWPEAIKDMQRNWIGRSEGAEVDFADRPDRDRRATIRVFTTRPDTLFGATYMVLAPEHPLVDQITTRRATSGGRRSIAARSPRRPTSSAPTWRRKRPASSPARYAINPVNGERIPIWIADYVLMGYGTGAIMAVPAHDERDLRIRAEVQLADHARSFSRRARRRGIERVRSEDGVAINSPLIDGLPTAEAKTKIIDWLEEHGSGADVNYKLRDWLFSRQRYWGEPFPIVWRRRQASTALPE